LSPITIHGLKFWNKQWSPILILTLVAENH
jgi:hypothetical protein